MTHIRKQIRDDIKTVLTGATRAGDNIFSSRIYSLSEHELPALLIYATEEEANIDSMGFHRGSYRELTINIEAMVKTNVTYADEIDELSEEVEKALSADTTLGGLAKDLMLESTDITYNADSEKPIAKAVLSYTVYYRVYGKDPSIVM